MIEGAKQYAACLDESSGTSQLANLSVIGIDQNQDFQIPTPKLILTSPPIQGFIFSIIVGKCLGERNPSSILDSKLLRYAWRVLLRYGESKTTIARYIIFTN
jgi:hypothetical protein